jgi:hypothetical protein
MTNKKYHYTYYSYEEWGMGYFGSRSCDCLPEEDISYFGSFSDKTFKPTRKIILKDDYLTRKDAMEDEIILHNYYDVAVNPHFANKSKLTSSGFICSKRFSDEEMKERRKMQKIIAREKWKNKNLDYEKKRWAKGLSEEQILSRRSREKKRYWENQKDRENRKARARERKRMLKDNSKY